MTGHNLFEISWEVCNKVGGIYTVLSSKARTLVERFGDDYLTIGPWLLSDTDREIPFDEVGGYEDLAEDCREAGLPIRVGRWRIPGHPLTILVEFSSLYEEKDDFLATLWEEYQVDSLSGDWDYVEPVLFGRAAARVIELYWERYMDRQHRRGVVQVHEWMTASALLYVKKFLPSLGTVFTTHATMLGRALSSLGHSPEDGLGDRSPDELAEEHGVVAKHSIEGVAAREADVFTTVSEITAREAELLHGRTPEPVLPNGIDLEVIDALAGPVDRDEARERVVSLASRFLGQDVSDALLVTISGRYEFHNKGIDILLDALARLNEVPGRSIVLFVLVPAGNSGVRREVLDRLERPLEEIDGPTGISTHDLFEREHDPVGEHCAKLGLDNAPDSRVRIVQIPIYLSETDGFLNLPYEAVLRAMDLSCFPSYYEPWGYTPQESLAVGVPTVTTDYAGFGRWAQGHELGPAEGLTVMRRLHRDYPEIVSELADVIAGFAESASDPAAQWDICRRTAGLTAWEGGLVEHYYEAFKAALEQVQERLVQGVPQKRRPKKLVVQPSPEGARPRLVPFEVSARLPEPLEDLRRLSRNFWWCWNRGATELFEELSPATWVLVEKNPVALLQRVDRRDLDARAADPGYLERLAAVAREFDDYVAAEPEEDRAADGTPGYSRERPIAYFCAEYGLHESLRIYSGGLGVLAGDHLKSASDVDLPLIAVGLYYRMGYMTQRLTSEGEQIAVDRENDPAALPLECVLGASGRPLEIQLGLPGRELSLRAWRVRVGRVDLYLLDANVPSNSEADRDITRNLYASDPDRRLQQEIVLGRGGARLLRALGIEPAVWHMNEGHAAFLTLERARHLVREQGLTRQEARELVRATTLFTTHTPVPAGHDRFSEDLMRRYFSDASEWAGLPWDRFMALGAAPESGEATEFNMTYLALVMSSWVNGVSRLHGQVSKSLLSVFWPRLLEAEVPVDSVTNGIHLGTWIAPSLARALELPAGPARGTDVAERARAVPTETLWRVKCEARARLVAEVRARLQKSFVERHDSPRLLSRMHDGLDENALWIGFARRFAPYKRADLMLKDLERLRAILDDEERPVRILVAGKAHPADEMGKDVLRSIAHSARSDELLGRLFLIENYDIGLARAMVQGVDVWLNNPTRGLEASGTSGMKVAANAGLNVSVGDGWWLEAWDRKNGWQIGDERAYEDQGLQDELDAGTLYHLLEEEIVPLFYERDEGGPPEGWVERMRASLATIPATFNTDRMVLEYADRAYRPLGRTGTRLSQDVSAGARHLAAEHERVRHGFRDVRITAAAIADVTGLKTGDPIDARVEVELGPLWPDDVAVELVLSRSARDGEPAELRSVALLPEGPAEPDAPRAWRGSSRLERSGGWAYGIRVRPRSAQDPNDPLRDLAVWA